MKKLDERDEKKKDEDVMMVLIDSTLLFHC